MMELKAAFVRHRMGPEKVTSFESVNENHNWSGTLKKFSLQPRLNYEESGLDSHFNTMLKSRSST